MKKSSILKEPSTMTIAKEAAAMFYKKYQKLKDKEVGSLFIEWTKEVFYGKLIKDAIPVFDFVWEELKKRHHTSRKRSLIYGDIDVSTWVEKTENKKILVYIRHCSMADDNTFIFIKEDRIIELPDFMEFRAVTVWPRQKKYRPSWGEYLNKLIWVPSLNTYRKVGFNYGYEDGRDKGFVFKYKARDELAEDAHYSEPKILRALDILEEIRSELIGI